ncbi:hypothetical protein BDZ85DRAFT_234813 [Elsinoe ampelina]|uniref:AAA+ ATPase domain-containing protein n=1 Tax=Elsinoe ampelina TaxID=302913 RepID=A0A6A6GF76_9PEZI|nr:hypothetical protein BDZ85DRAFT_234813 [Elsinoe ampelina]
MDVQTPDMNQAEHDQDAAGVSQSMDSATAETSDAAASTTSMSTPGSVPTILTVPESTLGGEGLYAQAETSGSKLEPEVKSISVNTTGSVESEDAISDDGDSKANDSDSSGWGFTEDDGDLDAAKQYRKHRMGQSLLWNFDIDLRLKHLESDLADLQGKPDLKPVSETSQEPEHEPSIKTMSWDEFRPPEAPKRKDDEPGKQHKYRHDPRQGHVIEVLREEPDQSMLRGSTRVGLTGPTMQSSAAAVKSDTVPRGSDTSSHPKSSSCAPARIRIRSRPVLEHLADVGGFVLGENTFKLVIRRPFKTLCIFEEKIRQRLDELEQKYAAVLDSAHDEPNAAPPDEKQRDVPELLVPPTKVKGASKKLKRGHTKDKSKAKPQDPTPGKWSPVALQHFRLLVRFMDEHLKDLFMLRKRIKEHAVDAIAFDDLWHLFHYTQEVFNPSRQEIKSGVYRVLYFTGGRTLLTMRLGPPSHSFIKDLESGGWHGAFGVQCWRLEYDGDAFVPTSKTFGIRRYGGLREITSLPIFPLSYHKNSAEVRREMIERGDRYIKYAVGNKHTHLKYLGPDFSDDRQHQQIDSEVIVDFKEAYAGHPWSPEMIDIDEDIITPDWRETIEDVVKNPHCKVTGCCTMDLIHSDSQTDDEVWSEVFRGTHRDALDSRNAIESEDDKMLLPGHVYGYVLRNRTWAKLSTSPARLRSVEGRNRWDDLVIPRSNKRTIEALVQRHIQRAERDKSSETSGQSDSFISGKGRGLVFLLHGPPGVGKTSTAECISIQTKLPLYQLTSGNLGVLPDDIERRLEKHFALAAKWGCILLLDEADVFLQQRHQAQLKINAIVSVFLRQLEYYPGILFLTTNRVGDIDRAFMSRIHMAVQYEPFSLKTTLKIYKMQLRILETAFASKNIPFRVKQKEIMAFAEKQYAERGQKRIQWNGRQIYNACQTAVALAEWDSQERAEKKAAKARLTKDSPQAQDGSASPSKLKISRVTLEREHFERVSKASDEFEDYVNSLSGAEYAMAERERTRYDYGAPQVSRGNSYFRNPPVTPQQTPKLSQQQQGDWPSEVEAKANTSTKKSSRGKSGKSAVEDDTSGSERKGKAKKKGKKKIAKKDAKEETETEDDSESDDESDGSDESRSTTSSESDESDASEESDTEKKATKKSSGKKKRRGSAPDTK